jgi:hypothetical protein
MVQGEKVRLSALVLSRLRASAYLWARLPLSLPGQLRLYSVEEKGSSTRTEISFGEKKVLKWIIQADNTEWTLGIVQ